jgi:hypothetical protein
MAFLSPDFDHDLFVSYPHNDSGTGKSPLKDWAAHFVETLQAELHTGEVRLPGLGIFFDQSERRGEAVDRDGSVDDQLRDHVKASALLLALVCPEYTNSHYCADELDWWTKARAANPTAPDRRPFVVRVMPVRDDKWPRLLLDDRGKPPLGYFLHEQGAQGEVRPFKWMGTMARHDEFHKVLQDLAGDVKHRLREMREVCEERRRKERERQRLAETGGQIVYLYARETDSQSWDEACQDLDQSGFTVWPPGPEPVPRDDREWQRAHEARVNMLTGCDALLLTGEPRSVIEDLLPVGVKSRRAAQSRIAKLLPCAVIDRTGSGLRSERSVREARKLGIYWLDAPQSPDWVTGLRSLLVRESGTAAQAP